jgi:uncharacterized protein
MDIEYAARKAAANLVKHGVGFDEAATALLDPQALAMEDRDAEGEARWVLVGMSERGRLLTIVYASRDEERIRLISARKATRKEAAYYASSI